MLRSKGIRTTPRNREPQLVEILLQQPKRDAADLTGGAIYL
jgi:hypothetical protein